MSSLLRRAGLGLLIATAVHAQRPATVAQPSAPPDPLHESGNNVTISLLTMGNGEEVWELFGHSAIWIHDTITGRDSVFNWGVFDSQAPNFIPHFLQGLMLYQIGGETYDELRASYSNANRSVTSQELELTASQKDSLLHLIAVNAEPGHRQYRYDYFIDNCATKPRDLLNRVLGGQIAAHANVPSGSSYRSETLRLMQGSKPIVLGVDIGLGEPADSEMTKWHAMFLPAKLHDYLNTVQVRDSAGALHPLVRHDSLVVRSTRPPEPTEPPDLAPWLLVAGLVISGLFGWLGVKATRGGRRNRGAAVAAATLIGLWSVVAGLLGVLLTLLWTITDHTFAHSNENLLLFNPLWLVMAVLFSVGLLTGHAWRWTRMLAILLGGLAALALALHVMRVSRQDNLPIIALALPAALVIEWIAAHAFSVGAGRDYGAR